jgi:hypothetical protein
MEWHRLPVLLAVIVLFVGSAFLVYLEMRPITLAMLPPVASASEATGGTKVAAKPVASITASQRGSVTAASAGVEAPAAAALPSAMPSFDIVRVESSGAAVIAGVAMPGSMVEMLDAGKPLAKTLRTSLATRRDKS